MVVVEQRFALITCESPFVGALLEAFTKLTNGVLKFRHMHCYDVPDSGHSHAVILMNRDVTKSCNRFPVFVIAPILEFIRQVLNGLSDNAQTI